jgi:hypothetical protein
MPEDPTHTKLMLGGETGDAALELESTSGSVQVVASPVHGNGEYSFEVDHTVGGNPDYGKVWGRNPDGQLSSQPMLNLKYLVFYVYFHTLPTSGTRQPILHIRNGSGDSFVRFEIGYAGLTTTMFRIRDYVGSASNLGAVSTGQWYEIALECTHTGSNDIDCWVDGALKVSSWGDGGPSGAVDIILGDTANPPASGQTYKIYIDDIIGRQDEMPSTSKAGGGNGFEILRFQNSNQTSCDTDWNGDGTDVDETPPPATGDIIYVDEASTANDAETIRFDGSSLDTLNADDGIEAIAHWGYFRCLGNPFVGFGQMRMKLFVGSTSDYTDNEPVKSSTWDTLSWVYFSNPDDSADWEKSDLFEDLQIGVDAPVVPVIANNDIEVATLWLMVAREIPSLVSHLRRGAAHTPTLIV